MDPYFQPILSSVKAGHIVHPGGDHQTAIHFDQLEGRAPEQWTHHIAITDTWAVSLVRALLKEREEQINRIAELEDQVRSHQEQDEATVWAALSPTEREQAIRGAA